MWYVIEALVFALLAHSLASGQTPPMCSFAANRSALWAHMENSMEPSVPSDSVMVIITMFFLSFYNIDEHQGTIWGNLYFIRAWKDERSNLKCLHPSLYLTAEQARRVWHPDVSLSALSVAHTDAPKTPEITAVLAGGYVAHAKKMLIQSACAMDFTYFPFDRMTCDFQVTPSGAPNEYVNITWAEKYPCHFIMSEMNLRSHEFERLELLREAGPDGAMGSGSYEYLTCRIYFSRFYVHYWFQMYIPNAITVMVAWISFFIMPDSAPARVTLGISSLIAMVLQYGNMAASLPKVSYLKGIDIWMLGCVVFIFSVLLEYAYVCKIKRSSVDKTTSVDTMDAHEKIGRIDACARWIYALLFISFAGIYLTVHIMS